MSAERSAAQSARGPLSGIRVLEVAAWAFVPSAGAVLSDWGADVVKVEPVVSGDPLRGLQAAGGPPPGAPTINFMVQVMNRGKRSVALDLAAPAGRELLLKLAAGCDVFLTSYLPGTRAKLGLDEADIRAVNSDVIYARGSGWGVRGDDADQGGFDAAAFTGRGGIAHVVTPPGVRPAPQRPAYGDIMSGLALAGGIAAAIAQRERTGHAGTVDVSLLGTAVWNLAPDIAASALYEGFERPQPTPGVFANPAAGTYATADGRYLSLVLLDSQRFWPDLCRRIGRDDMIEDVRYASAAARRENRVACCAELSRVFGSRDLADWVQALAGFDGVWAPNATPDEVRRDPQVLANGYTQVVEVEGAPFTNVVNPVQFDEAPAGLRPAPEHGMDTDVVLAELGLGVEELLEHKISGAVL